MYAILAYFYPTGLTLLSLLLAGNKSDGTPSSIYFKLINTNNYRTLEELKEEGRPSAREYIAQEGKYSVSDSDISKIRSVKSPENQKFLTECGDYEAFIGKVSKEFTS